MKKKIVGVFAILLTTVLLALMLSACGSDSIVGTWKGVNSDAGYYGNFLVFNEDGTGLVGIIPFTWTTKNGVLSISAWGKNSEHSYKVRGKTLTLKEITDGDESDVHEAMFEKQ